MKTISPDSADQDPLPGRPVLFLAGSIDEGRAEQWQSETTAVLSDLDATILNPRRDDWDADLRQSEDEPRFVAQVDWELDGIALADVVLFYFSPAGPAPVSLLELGISQGKTIVVACPRGYWRRGNVERVCRRAGVIVHETLEDALAAAHDVLTVAEPGGRTHQVALTVSEALLVQSLLDGIPHAGDDEAGRMETVASLRAKAHGVLTAAGQAAARASARRK